MLYPSSAAFNLRLHCCLFHQQIRPVNIQNRKTILRLLTAVALLFAACHPEPDPEPGFSETMYFSMDFLGEQLHIESDDVQTDYFWSGGNFGVNNIFKHPYSSFDIQISITFDGEISRQEVLDMEGQNLPIVTGENYPWVRIYLESTDLNGQDYSTNVFPIDYGDSKFIVEKVIKGPKIEYREPFGGDEKTGRSYFLRGRCTLDISKNFWSADEPEYELFPIRNGRFSLRVIVP